MTYRKEEMENGCEKTFVKQEYHKLIFNFYSKAKPFLVVEKSHGWGWGCSKRFRLQTASLEE